MNKIPGRVGRDGVLHKRVKTQNILRLPEPSWCLAVFQVDAAQQDGAHGVELEDERGIRYHASLDLIRAKGTAYQKPPWEPQIRLPLRLWAIADPAQPELFGGRS